MQKFHVRYPQRRPWFGNIRHGPCFKNFVIPMLTESNDERNVMPNIVCLPDFKHTSNIQILSSNKSDSFSIIKSNAIMNKMTNCGNASTRVSENLIVIEQLTKILCQMLLTDRANISIQPLLFGSPQ